ncbi:MAG: ABC transporter permease [Clostridium sp.]
MGLYLRIKRMGKLAGLIIISLALSMTIINSSLVQFRFSESQANALETLFNKENTYLFTYEGYDGSFEDSLKDSQEMYNHIEVLKKKGLVSNSYIYNPYGPVTEIQKSAKTYEELERARYFNRSIVMDWDFYKRNGLEIIRGRGFTKEEFEKRWNDGVVPVIVGIENEEELNGKYKFYYNSIEKNENGKYEIKDFMGEYEVVGVYKTKSVPLIDINDRRDQLTPSSEDAFVIFPTNKGNEFYNLHRFGVYLELQDGVSPDEILKEFEDASKQMEVSKYVSLGATSSVVSALSLDRESTLFLGAILLILSILGAISMMIGHFMKRQLEIGVKQSIGASMQVVFKEVFKDMLFISWVATFMSLYFTLLINKAPYERWVLITNFIVSIIVAFLITILPILKIKRIEIVDLMRKR